MNRTIIILCNIKMNRPIQIGDHVTIRFGPTVTKYFILEITPEGIRISKNDLLVTDGVNWKVKGLMEPHQVDWHAIESLEKFAVYSPTYEHSKLLRLSNSLEQYGTLGDKLGEGSFGVVFKVTGSSYAVKILREISITDSIMEIAALKRLTHPNIVEIIDVVTIKDKVGIIMPLSINNLGHVLEHNTFNIEELDKITYQIICGIAYMHSRHIIHRDIKLHNILFYGLDDIRLSDFGYIQPFACEPEEIWSNQVYSPAYRAPEIFLGGVGRYTMSAAVWALACIIWEIYDRTHRTLFVNAVMNEQDNILDMSPIGIYNILGTPTSEWRDLPLMLAYVPPRNVILPNRSRINDALPNDSLRDMINSVLIYNASDRPTAYELLKNSYFDNVRVPQNESAPINCSPSHMTREMRVDSYFEALTYIKPHMRNILVDWLISVSDRFKSTLKTYLLTISILDRVTYILNPNKSQYHLLGIASLSLADALGEPSNLYNQDFVYMGGGAYDEDGLINMKSKILEALNYDMLTTVSYDHHQDSTTLGISDDGKEIIYLFLRLFTMYNIIFILFPREQFLLACGLLMIITDHPVKNTPLDEDCRSLASIHIKSVLIGLNKTRNISPRPPYLIRYKLENIIEKLTEYKQ
jgi:cyclin-dependent kinase 2